MLIYRKMCFSSKSTILLCWLFLSAILQYSCNPEEDQEPLTFPTTYQYQELDFRATKFYVLTATSFQEISASGNYTAYDGILKDILDINTTEFEIEQLELLDDHTVKVTFFDNLNIMPSDTVLNYTLNDNVLSVNIGTVAIKYLLDTDNNNIRLSLLTLHHSWHPDPMSVDYSPMDVSFDLPADAATQISQRRNQFGLQAGDTIAINNSYYRYSKL
ncbi:MAG: hypothetical protein JNM22_03800 [Saprospiraceae bacterium]|nr:hypothetical protein [Saprospiraceae bacterium]